MKPRRSEPTESHGELDELSALSPFPSQSTFTEQNENNNCKVALDENASITHISPTARLRLNVGGRRFVLLGRSLVAFPFSYLSKFYQWPMDIRLQEADDFMEDSQEYYFERSGEFFEQIANAYRTGTLHVPDSHCTQLFYDELKLWGMKDAPIAPCCAHKLDSLTDRSSTLHHHNNSAREGVHKAKASNASNPSERCRRGRCEDIRYRVWKIMEQPSSSRCALVFMLISCGLVGVTMCVLVLSSLDQFKYVDPVTNMTEVMPLLDIIDSGCVVAFTLEYLLRLWASPDRFEYLQGGLSVIDLAAILPFYVELFLNFFGVENRLIATVRRSVLVMRMLRVLRVLRALRILKVARYSMGFQSMGETLKRSWRELALLVMFMLTTNLMFSTAMYFIEQDHPKTHFPNIPAACWWCVITMTTVGYGDVYPQTVCGKLLAGAVSITGIILLAFPISVIVDTFNQEYQERQGEKDAEPTGDNVQKFAHDVNQKIRTIDGKLYIEVEQPHRRKAGKMF